MGTGLTLAEARKRSNELSRRYQDGDRDLRATLEAEKREKDRQQSIAEQAALNEAARLQGTLGVLLMAYCAQLVRDGKVSAPKVEKALRLHVEAAWPRLWNMPAADVTSDDLMHVIARLVDTGKLREADKVRSYITAAYTAGIRARQNARALSALRDIRITSNPARDLVAVDGGSNTRERALSVAELRAYWKRIDALPDPDGALLRFHLLTGSQRVEQLARLTTQDLDNDTATVRLLDPKGRRRRPREHVVPLVPAAVDALRTMKGGTLGPYLFTVTQGHSGAVYAIVQHRVRAIADAMNAAGELEHSTFTPGDLRRTVETRLAAEGVTEAVRAQLQSHGLGGVQARHYDRHGYDNEKREALETLHRLIIGSSATVTSIKRAASRKSSDASR